MNDSPRSAQRYVVLAWLCAAAAISYICRNGLSVMESTIRKELEISPETMGSVMAIFFIPYAVGQLPGGWVADRLGSRRAILIAAVGWSIATLSLGLAQGFMWLAIAWCANGLFQAGLFPASTHAFSKWFPANRKAVASGWLASAMSVGAAGAASAAAFLVGKVGWRWTCALSGMLGIVWAIGFFRTYYERPEESPKVTADELALIRHPVATSAKSAADVEIAGESVWAALLLSPATWFICGQQFCRAAGQIFFGTWFPTYLQEAKHLSVPSSGFFTSLPIGALVIGALAGGMVSDSVLTWTGSRRWARQGVASICMFICSLFVFGSNWVEEPRLAVLVISVGMVFAAIGGPAAYAITMDMGGKHVAKLFGCMNMVGNFGAALTGFAVPRILKWTGDWDHILLIFGFLWLGAGAFWLLLNPNGTVFQYSLLRLRSTSPAP